LRDHRGERGSGGAQVREEVHLHGPLEVVVGDSQESVETKPHGPDVVDEHVDAAVVLDGACDERGGCSCVGQIGGDRCDSVKALEARRGARARYDVRAFVGQRFGHRETDAFAGRGDDRDLAVEQKVHLASLEIVSRSVMLALAPPTRRSSLR
jgi:hypothetical protein